MGNPLEVAGAVGKFIGQDKKYGEFGLFAGPAPWKKLVFFHGFKRVLVGWIAAATLGLGLRLLHQSLLLPEQLGMENTGKRIFL